ncbi:MAG: hypothetical protein ACK5C5_03575 [Bacteroidota bacterium]|jgi:hypothetical protein
MFKLDDAHIEFIRSDIRSRGVTTDALIDDIVDHVCCLLEERVGEGDDFNEVYVGIINKFYGSTLSDIETETQLLKQFKNYYTMKKTMLYSGLFATISLIAGLILKFTHSPGAAFLIVVGIIVFSFLFLPLIVVLKTRDQGPKRDIMLTAVGSLCGMLFALGTLFKIMYWPYANFLGISGIVTLGLIYIPIHFFTGIRNPETKINSILTTFVLITGLGLLLTLMRSPEATHRYQLQKTAEYLEDERMLDILMRFCETNGMQQPMNTYEVKVDSLCRELKKMVIQLDTNQDALSVSVMNGNEPINDGPMQRTLRDDEKASAYLKALRKALDEYNSQIQLPSQHAQPITSALFMKGEMRTVDVLSAIAKIRLGLLLNR